VDAEHRHAIRELSRLADASVIEFPQSAPGEVSGFLCYMARLSSLSSSVANPLPSFP
jgi:hypothetical protein